MIAGFAVGYIVPLLPFLILFGVGAWPYVLLFGTMVAAIPFLATIVLFTVLQQRDQLRIWWAVLAGAIAAALPLGFIIISTTLDPNGWTGTEMEMWRNGGPVSLAGLQYFVLPMVPFAVLGGLAGLAGWLTAYGWRLSSPKLAIPPG